MQKFGIGQPVPRIEDPRFITGRGRYVDDFDLPHQCHGVVVMSPHAHARIKSVGHDKGQSRRRRIGRAHRRRCDGRRTGRAGAADAAGYGRAERLSHAARDPRRQEGPRGRRARRFRRRGDAQSSAQRRRADRDRIRAAAGRDRRRGRGEAGRAGAVGRSAEQHLVHADDGQQGRNRRRLCQCQARRQAQAQQCAHQRQFDRAARRDRPISSRQRQLHIVLDDAEPARHPLVGCRPGAESRRDKTARHLARCRRRLRHEARRLPRGRAGGLGVTPRRRPPGEMDRRRARRRCLAIRTAATRSSPENWRSTTRGRF